MPLRIGRAPRPPLRGAPRPATTEPLTAPTLLPAGKHGAPGAGGLPDGLPDGLLKTGCQMVDYLTGLVDMTGDNRSWESAEIGGGGLCLLTTHSASDAGIR